MGQTAPFYQELSDFELFLLFLEGVSQATPKAISQRPLLGSDDYGTISISQVCLKTLLGTVDSQIAALHCLILNPRNSLFCLKRFPPALKGA